MLPGLGALLLAVQLAATGLLRAKRDRIERDLRHLTVEWSAMEGTRIRPDTENLKLLREEFQHLRELEITFHDALFPERTEDPTVGGLSPTELFFQIAAFIERMTERAADAGIAHDPGLAFGFAAPVQARQVVLTGGAGSPEGQQELAAMRFQLEVLEFLCEALIDARPVELIAIRREPATVRESALSTAAEIFQRDARRTSGIQLPVDLHSCAYLLSFRGRTDSLRSLLGALHQSGPLLLVQRVQVFDTRNEGFSGSRSDRRHAGMSGDLAFGAAWRGAALHEQTVGKDGAVPVVDANLAVFEVVVESIVRRADQTSE